MKLGWVAVVAPGLVACVTPELAAVPETQSVSFTQRFGPGAPRELDVLLVLDSSGSMDEEQRGLAGALRRFAAGLERLGGVSWRVGVTTTDLGTFGFPLESCEGSGDDGRLLEHRGPGCPEGRWLSHDDGDATHSVADALGCMTQVGVEGCGFEMPLGAARRALEHPANEGFLRPDALLAVVLVTDEDDCTPSDPAVLDPADSSLGPATSFRCFSQGIVCDGDDPFSSGPRTGCRPRPGGFAPPEELATLLRALRSDRVLLAVIAGTATPVYVGMDAGGAATLLPSCSSGFGSAAPGVRLAAATDAMGDQGLFLSLCDGDMAPALDLIGGRIEGILAERCLAERPGACSVVADGEVLPPCGTAPCYRFAEDASCAASGLALEIDGGSPEMSIELACEAR